MGQDREGSVLQLERTELLIYNLPDNLIGGHSREIPQTVRTVGCRGTNKHKDRQEIEKKSEISCQILPQFCRRQHCQDSCRSAKISGSTWASRASLSKMLYTLQVK